MLARISIIAAVCLALAGCGVFSTLDRVMPDNRTDYQRAESLPDLEVPPELSTSAIQDRMPIPTEGASYQSYQQRVAQEQTASSRCQRMNTDDGNTYLTLNESLGTAWESVATALDRANIDVREQIREQNSFVVHYLTEADEDAPSGILARIGFGRRNDNVGEYKVALTEAGEATEIRILNGEDEWVSNLSADRLIDNLYVQLR